MLDDITQCRDKLPNISQKSLHQVDFVSGDRDSCVTAQQYTYGET